MREFSIEKLGERHLKEVVEIERASFSTPWSESSLYSEMKNPNTLSYAALVDSALAGYVYAKRVHDEGHILNVAVNPDLRRQGIGKALTLKVLDELKGQGCRAVYLEVRASNLPARRLYEGLGFRVIAQRRSYYLMPVEDAVVMELNF